MNIDANEVIAEYKNRLTEATYQNILLTAQAAGYGKKVEELEERLAQLEARNADVKSDEPIRVVEGSVED